ncbi:MAG TPA: hypothetical protein VE969_00910 [Pyrinomonadaceae bacterium]|nr:hypothetical protein [Pyrinomonadaceae bacterium]
MNGFSYDFFLRQNSTSRQAISALQKGRRKGDWDQELSLRAGRVARPRTQIGSLLEVKERAAVKPLFPT